MSKILYYSNFCNNCKKLLQDLAKSSEKKDIHFICIDNRIKKDGKIYIILENQQEMLLPSNINRVPALLFLNKQTDNLIFGETIAQTLKPNENLYSNNIETVINKEEPIAFAFSSGGSNIMSDSYSFWDQNADELLTKGEGGLRQMYNYSKIDDNIIINTPKEDYIADKIGNVKLEDLEKQRNLPLTNN